MILSLQRARLFAKKAVRVGPGILGGLLASHRDYAKYIVLARPRTGSTLLNLMLRSHPAVCAWGESFGRIGGQREDLLLAGIFSRYPERVRGVGFKIHYNHPVDVRHPQIWQLLAEMDGLHVIHLKRRNLLRTIVSSQIAQKLSLTQIQTAGDRPDLAAAAILGQISYPFLAARYSGRDPGGNR